MFFSLANINRKMILQMLKEEFELVRKLIEIKSFSSSFAFHWASIARQLLDLNALKQRIDTVFNLFSSLCTKTCSH